MDKVYELIPLLPAEICSKLRLYLETPSAKIIREKESEPEPWVNRCLECGVDMGDCNPRQYCGKWRCYFS